VLAVAAVNQRDTREIDSNKEDRMSVEFENRKPQPFGAHCLFVPTGYEFYHGAVQSRTVEVTLERVSRQLQHIDGEIRAIDVGSRIGESASLICQSAAADILCIEGRPEYLPFLYENVGRIKPGSIRVVPHYCYLSGDYEWKATEPESTDRVGSSDLSGGPRSLDSLLDQHSRYREARFLRIDVEGYELSVIQGALGLIGKRHPAILLNLYPNRLSENNTDPLLPLRVLAEQGYSCFLIYDEQGTLLKILDVTTDQKMLALARNPTLRAATRLEILAVPADKLKRYSAILAREISRAFIDKGSSSIGLHASAEEANNASRFALQLLADSIESTNSSFQQRLVALQFERNDALERLQQLTQSKVFRLSTRIARILGKAFPPGRFHTKVARWLVKRTYKIAKMAVLLGRTFLKWKPKVDGPSRSSVTTASQVLSLIGPRIFVDVTRISSNDLGTGVQRVVRAILSRLLEDNELFYDIVPIRADTHGDSVTYVAETEWSASNFPSNRLNAKVGKISGKRGDIIILLDLVPEVAQASEWLREQRRAHVRIVSVVYDLLPVRNPQYFVPGNDAWFRQWLTAIIDSSDQIICISKTTQSDLQNWMRSSRARANAVSNSKISHFQMGADFDATPAVSSHTNDSQRTRGETTEQVNFLMVGTVEPRKGYADIVKAMEILWGEGINARLVIVGKVGWTSTTDFDVGSLVEQSPWYGKKLEWIKDLSDTELVKLYESSDALIAASYAEGFGLPIIEALKSRIHVLARDIPVFREVAGENAVYFDGSEPEIISSQIKDWLERFRTNQLPSTPSVVWPKWQESYLQFKGLLLKTERVAYIGHSFHSRTRSTDFLLDMLQDYYTVERIDDTSWKTGHYPDLSHLDESYAAVVFFQSLPPPDVLKSIRNPNLVFAPMYDGYGGNTGEWWKEKRRLKLLNFSSTLQKRHQEWGLDACYFQYFPELQPFEPGVGRTAFLWQRTEAISFETVKALFREGEIAVHLHLAPDPEHKVIEPTEVDSASYAITTSEWFETSSELHAVLRTKQIYVAPRIAEGIGLSFLEAMSMGKVVVGADSPTMNEYIRNGKTGYLFKVEKPRRLSLANLDRVQRNTHSYMAAGRVVWEKRRRDLMRFLFSFRPKISVVTVCYNEEQEIARTCESVVRQTYNNIEWIVVDGSSTDKTLDILARYESSISHLVSESDRGIYDAMNKGIRLSSGDFLIFMNAGDAFVDDYVVSDIFSDLAHSGDVVFGDAQVVLEDGARVRWKMEPKISMSYLLSFVGINHQSAFIRRSAFESFGGYDSDLRYAADSEKWCCFLENGCSFVKVDRDVALYKGFDGMSSTPANTRQIQRERDGIIARYYRGDGASGEKH
jgi:FkbM family methyltransferase